MDITADQLRTLVFTAEQEHGRALGPDAQAHVPAAHSALLQLQCFLSSRAAQSPARAQQSAGLLEECTKRLHTLRVHTSKSEARQATLGRILAKAGCQEGFKFSNPRGFNLLADLKNSEPFKHILQVTPRSQAAQVPKPPGPRSLGQPAPHQQAAHAVPYNQQHAGLQPPHQPSMQQPLLPPQQQQQQQQQSAGRRSGFQVPPPSKSGHLATAASVLRQHPVNQAQPPHQQASLPQAPTQQPRPFQGAGPPPQPPAGQQHQQQQHQQQQGPPLGPGFAWASNPGPPSTGTATGPSGAGTAPPPQRGGDGGESRWGPPKVLRRAQDSHVHQARQQQQQGRGGSEEAGEGSDEEADQGCANPFQSAKSKLITDMRKSGQPNAASAYLNQQQGPPPRQGLMRPGGRGGGGRRMPAAGGQGGVNKGFVPPFVKKALDVQNGGSAAGNGAGGGGGQGGGEGEAEGPLSLRTREFLRLGPDEPLPEELAKLDPQMIEQVCNDIVETGKTSWEDIAGQEVAKKLIQEVVVWPLLNPHIFTGARAPPKGILLFGPPGTGKTLLGKAIASNINATFFSISASSLTSKWIGEGEKMVRTLFAVAGCVAPSVIFIDEIDSLLSARKSEGEHEASRRLKTEMLVQMEGCDPNSADRRVLLIGATNRPEELDEAARRRMPKQLYIPLPDADARRGMVLRQLGPGAPIRAALSEADVQKVVRHTDGYSGSDMKNLIQEACQGPVRDAVKQHGSGVASLQAEDLRPVVLRDFQLAARAQKASVEPSEIVRYEQYNEKHGAKILAEEEQQMEDDDDW